jgi:hypothetical protein
MPEHLFQIGQKLIYKSTRLSGAAPGSYIITKQMPPEGGEFKYRIRSVDELHERMVNEGELVAVNSPSPQPD